MTPTRTDKILRSVMEEMKQDVVRGTWGTEMLYLGGVAGKGMLLIGVFC